MGTGKFLYEAVLDNKQRYYSLKRLIRYIYYPTLLRRVQLTSTKITRYLYSSHSPDRAKDKKPWQVRILGKRKRWIIRSYKI